MPRYLISFDDGAMDSAVIGGCVIIDVSSLQEALEWAARFAAACRCAQEVREVMFDPLV